MTRVWTLVDDATREAPLVLVDRSLPAARVVEALDTLLVVRGCHHRFEIAQKHRVKLHTRSLFRVG